jgi:hypothetical protein
MNNEFIPYEEALTLKELGFNEPCFGLYLLGRFMYSNPPMLSEDIINSVEVLAPLYQQAFRWLREKHDITQTIARDSSLAKEGHWAYTIVYDGIYFNDGYLTYEEAELACLKKLIELVKTKTNV